MKLAMVDVETKGLYGDFILGGVLIDEEPIFFDNKEKMKAFLQDLEEKQYVLVGFNLIYDFTVLDYKPKSYKNFHDLMLYAKAISGMLDIEKFGLDDLVEHLKVYKYLSDKKTIHKLLEKGVVSFDIQKYLTEDLVAVKKLFDYFAKFFPAGSKVYNVDKMILLILLDIQKRGLPLNINEAESLLKKYKIDLLGIAEFFRKRYNLNVNSPLQIAKKYNLPNAQRKTLIEFLIKSEQDKNGNNTLVSDIKGILQYKEKAKIVEFLTKFLKVARRNNNKVTGYFHPCGAISGRMSCSNENLMQIPKELRKIFQTDKYFLVYDFSQIELRLAGQMWKEPLFIKAFQNDEDLHTLTTQKIFKKMDVTKEERHVGKTFNFAMLYGAGINTLYDLLISANLMYSLETIKEFRNLWYDLYKTIQKHHWELIQYFKNHNEIVVETALGRIIKAKRFSDALNFPIQGTGADLLKGVVIKFLKKCPDAKVLNLIHDELQIECESEEEAQEYAKILDQSLQEAWQVIFPEVLVPVKGEASISKSLAK
jgi:DNA polymerase-1